MKKYFWVAKNTWEETLTYRFNFLMWRIRTVVLLLSVYFLWHSVIPEGSRLFGYTQNMMLTYILLTSITNAFVISTRTHEIGDEINSGDLSNFLIKPINYFLYWFWKDIGDKAMNIVFSIAELTILFFILRPPVFIQTDFTFLSLFCISIFLAIVLYFFVNILLGMIGFWSPEVWAPRFIFSIILGFFAGNYFPLDILPNTVFKIFEALPFSYLIYFPIKIYLGQIGLPEILNGFLLMVLWIGIFFIFVQVVWRKGLKAYTAQGR
ncbi:MAG: ABC-2 family transporter protein [Candidatus Levybacteria bacterium]|nr:ABC-2 family transporter protein [Candidatus Levybacteria bacterium]MBI2420869.1 ABC-2 family transporter protein [Candidatus Levybacteria bacterium]